MKTTYRHHHPSASRLERMLARLVRVETLHVAPTFRIDLVYAD